MKETVTRFIGVLALLALVATFFPCDSHGHDHGCAPDCSCVAHAPADLAPLDAPHLSVPIADRLVPRTPISAEFSLSDRIFRPPIA
jgi:hypothetical protein